MQQSVYQSQQLIVLISFSQRKKVEIERVGKFAVYILNFSLHQIILKILRELKALPVHGSGNNTMASIEYTGAWRGVAGLQLQWE